MSKTGFLLVLWLCLFFPLQYAYASGTCENSPDREIVEVLDWETNPAEKFKALLDQKFSRLSSWKKKLLFALWEQDLKENKKVHYSFNTHKDSWLYLFFFGGRFSYSMWDSFREVKNDENLKGGKKAKIVAKIVLSELISHAYVYALLLFTFFEDDILDSAGMIMNDPLLDETDPSDLEDDEIIVIVQLLDDSDGVGKINGKIIAKLQKEHPHKIRVIDLSMRTVTGDDEARARVEKFVEKNLKKSGLRIKKLIVTSHGLPGSLSFPGGFNPQMDMSDFADDILKPLAFYTLPGTEIHSGACLLAANKKGEKEVREFAKRMLPYGGSIKVNRTVGFAGEPMNTRDKAILGTLSAFLHPALHLATPRVIITTRAALDKDTKKYKTGPYYFKSVTYKYHVGATSFPLEPEKKSSRIITLNR